MILIIHPNEIILQNEKEPALKFVMKVARMRALNSYTEKRFSRLVHLLESVRDSDDEELLHQIRLEVKKLKAILQLIQFKFPSLNTHKFFIPLRTIFRKAGEIREPHVLEQLLGRYGLDAIAYSSIFPSEKTVKSFRKKIPAFIKESNNSEKIIRRKIAKIKGKDLSKYLKNKKKDLAKKIFPDIHPRTLHKSRKLIKEVLYLSSIKKREQLHPFFSEIANMIGEWNDKQIIIQLLKNNGLPHRIVIQKLERDSKKNLSDIQKAITDYYTLQ